MVKTIKILISGRVQGVFFRDFVKQQADKLNIKGFSRNIADNFLEIMAQGDEKSLKKLISKVKTGPKFAKVDKIDVSAETSDEVFNEFKILY